METKSCHINPQTESIKIFPKFITVLKVPSNDPMLIKISFVYLSEHTESWKSPRKRSSSETTRKLKKMKPKDKGNETTFWV